MNLDECRLMDFNILKAHIFFCCYFSYLLNRFSIIQQKHLINPPFPNILPYPLKEGKKNQYCIYCLRHYTVEEAATYFISNVDIIDYNHTNNV